MNVLELDDLLADTETPEKEGELLRVDFDESAVKRYIAAKVAENDAKALKEQIGAGIERAAEGHRLTVSATSGALTRSLLLAGALRYTCQNRWPKLTAKMGEQLSRTYNGRFSNYFQSVKAVTLDVKALVAAKADPDVAAALTLLREKQVLCISSTWKPTERFFADYTFDATVRQSAQDLGVVPVSMLALPKSISTR